MIALVSSQKVRRAGAMFLGSAILMMASTLIWGCSNENDKKVVMGTDVSTEFTQKYSGQYTSLDGKTIEISKDPQSKSLVNFYAYGLSNDLYIRKIGGVLFLQDSYNHNAQLDSNDSLVAMSPYIPEGNRVDLKFRCKMKKDIHAQNVYEMPKGLKIDRYPEAIKSAMKDGANIAYIIAVPYTSSYTNSGSDSSVTVSDVNLDLSLLCVSASGPAMSACTDLVTSKLSKSFKQKASDFCSTNYSDVGAVSVYDLESYSYERGQSYQIMMIESVDDSHVRFVRPSNYSTDSEKTVSKSARVARYNVLKNLKTLHFQKVGAVVKEQSLINSLSDSYRAADYTGANIAPSFVISLDLDQKRVVYTSADSATLKFDVSSVVINSEGEMTLSLKNPVLTGTISSNEDVKKVLMDPKSNLSLKVKIMADTQRGDSSGQYFFNLYNQDKAVGDNFSLSYWYRLQDK